MLKVAIMGHGTVGSGVYDVFAQNASQITRAVGEQVEVKYVLDLRDFSNLPYADKFVTDFASIVLGGLFGVPGMACCAMLVLAMACGSEPFGYDYLYPLMPPGPAAWRDGFVRSIWSRLARPPRP